VYTIYFIDNGELIIDELKLESTHLKIQTIVTVEVNTDCAHGKAIRCNFKPGSVERSIDD
jgi:hypothetical protein